MGGRVYYQPVDRHLQILVWSALLAVTCLFFQTCQNPDSQLVFMTDKGAHTELVLEDQESSIKLRITGRSAFLSRGAFLVTLYFDVESRDSASTAVFPGSAVAVFNGHPMRRRIASEELVVYMKQDKWHWSEPFEAEFDSAMSWQGGGPVQQALQIVLDSIVTWNNEYLFVDSVSAFIKPPPLGAF